ncbi:MAG: hypothetical protein Q8P63_02090 [Candidatus Nealsonbacteria bacterium]|nr:hypothetical protein [Candidatus Nealsonbacteria bacterium]
MKTFEELYREIEKGGTVKSATKLQTWTPEELVEIVKNVRKSVKENCVPDVVAKFFSVKEKENIKEKMALAWKIHLNPVTRANDLRRKVYDLLVKEVDIPKEMIPSPEQCVG